MDFRKLLKIRKTRFYGISFRVMPPPIYFRYMGRPDGHESISKYRVERSEANVEGYAKGGFMKYLRLTVAAVGMCALVALGCQKGDTGDTGPAGPTGTQGPLGQRGTTGNLTALPVTGTVILSLGGGGGFYSGAPFANPDSGSLYSYDMSSGALTRLGYTGFIELNALAVSPTAKLAYAGQGMSQSGQIIKIDLSTGYIQPLISKIGVRRGVVGLAFSSNGVLFATYADGGPGLGLSNFALATVDPNTGEGTLVTPLSSSVRGIGFSPNGSLLGFFNGILRSINITTGAVTTVPGVQNCRTGSGPGANGFTFRSSTEIVGATGGVFGTGGKPILFDLNLLTGACTPITLTTFPYSGAGGSSVGAAIAP